jgi:hypothetical protein
MFRTTALVILLSVVLCACSADTDQPAAPAPVASASPASKPVATEQVVVRMGMVFTESDPVLMGGGEILRGSLHVGDRAELLASDGKRVGVRIDEIRDDDSKTLVASATAPASVFLTFTADAPSMTGEDHVLAGADRFVDFASARDFVDAIVAAHAVAPRDHEAAD